MRIAIMVFAFLSTTACFFSEGDLISRPPVNTAITNTGTTTFPEFPREALSIRCTADSADLEMLGGLCEDPRVVFAPILLEDGGNGVVMIGQTPPTSALLLFVLVKNPDAQSDVTGAQLAAFVDVQPELEGTSRFDVEDELERFDESQAVDGGALSVSKVVYECDSTMVVSGSLRWKSATLELDLRAGHPGC